MPPSSSQSPTRKRPKRFLSSQGPRWKSPSRTAPPGRRRSSAGTTPFNFSPGNASDADDTDHDSGLEDDASVISNPETFAVLQPSSTQLPLTYSSLPPTPISTSPFPRRSSTPPLPPTLLDSPEPVKKAADTTPFSLWDYLREELLATDFDSHQELKWERVSNFLSMPFAIEKVMSVHNPLRQANCLSADHGVWIRALP